MSHRHLGAATSRVPAGVLMLVLGVGTACSTAAPPHDFSKARGALESCRDLQVPPDPTLTAPVETRRVQPRPPRDSGSSGYACIRVTVFVSGNLTDPEILRTDNPGFARACLDAVKEWRYKPALREGVPVSTPLLLSFSFTRP